MHVLGCYLFGIGESPENSVVYLQNMMSHDRGTFKYLFGVGRRNPQLYQQVLKITLTTCCAKAHLATLIHSKVMVV